MSKCKVFNLTLEGLTKGQVEGRVAFIKNEVLRLAKDENFEKGKVYETSTCISFAGLDILTKTGQEFDTITSCHPLVGGDKGDSVYEKELLPLLKEELGGKIPEGYEVSHDYFDGCGYIAMFSERTQDGDTEFHFAIKFNNGEVRYLMVNIPWFAFESEAVNSLFVPGHLLVKSA